MKSILKRVFVALVVLLVAGCQSKTEQELDKLNKSLPLKIGEIGSLNGAFLEGNNVVFVMNINDKSAAIFSSDDPKTDAQFVIRSGHFMKVSKDFAGEGHGIVLRYVGVPSDRKLDIVFSKDDLDELAEKGPMSKKEIAECNLELIATKTKKELPLKVEAGFYYVDLKVDDNVSFIYSVDDTKEEPVELIDKNSDALIEDFIKMTGDDKDFATITMFKHTVDAGKGFSMVYRGSVSRKELVISVPNSKLRSFYIKYLQQILPLK